MGETPETREKLFWLGLKAGIGPRETKTLVEMFEAHGLRIVLDEPTQAMMEAIQAGDTCLEAWKAALAVSPIAPEETANE